MTAHELARRLIEGPDLIVTVRGYEEGSDEINTIEQPKELNLNYFTVWYYGNHSYTRSSDECIKVQAINLSK